MAAGALCGPSPVLSAGSGPTPLAADPSFLHTGSSRPRWARCPARGSEAASSLVNPPASVAEETAHASQRSLSGEWVRLLTLRNLHGHPHFLLPTAAHPNTSKLDPPGQLATHIVAAQYCTNESGPATTTFNDTDVLTHITLNTTRCQTAHAGFGEGESRPCGHWQVR